MKDARKYLQIPDCKNRENNTCMILLDTEILPDNDVEGTLVYAGKGNTEEYTRWFKQEKPITPVYFDSAELEDGVAYDE